MHSHGRAAIMRTSEAERQRAAEFLRDACAEGRLGPDELEARLDRLFRSHTVAEIADLVDDLPRGRTVVPRLDPRAARPSRTLPARRRPSPAGPLAFAMILAGTVILLAGALPPLIVLVFAAIVLSLAVAAGVLAIALAPVGLALFGIAWLIDRLVRGRGGRAPAWHGGHGHRHRFP
jgi:uncharacterized protein DUF1707